jgi:hypothetical protein
LRGFPECRAAEGKGEHLLEGLEILKAVENKSNIEKKK